jgi:hypothetical protein
LQQPLSDKVGSAMGVAVGRGADSVFVVVLVGTR